MTRIEDGEANLKLLWIAQKILSNAIYVNHEFVVTYLTSAGFVEKALGWFSIHGRIMLRKYKIIEIMISVVISQS